MKTDFDRSIGGEPGVEPCGGTPCPAVGQALRDRQQSTSAEQRAQWLEEQYRRDLEVIARCEEQLEREAGCRDFFSCMAELSSRRRA